MQEGDILRARSVSLSLYSALNLTSLAPHTDLWHYTNSWLYIVRIYVYILLFVVNLCKWQGPCSMKSNWRIISNINKCSEVMWRSDFKTITKQIVLMNDLYVNFLKIVGLLRQTSLFIYTWRWFRCVRLTYRHECILILSWQYYLTTVITAAGLTKRIFICAVYKAGKMAF